MAPAPDLPLPLPHPQTSNFIHSHPCSALLCLFRSFQWRFSLFHSLSLFLFCYVFFWLLCYVLGHWSSLLFIFSVIHINKVFKITFTVGVINGNKYFLFLFLLSFFGSHVSENSQTLKKHLSISYLYFLFIYLVAHYLRFCNQQWLEKYLSNIGIRCTL